MIITISRQAATNGDLIARLVAERLHLHVFDGELVDEIARRAHKDPEVVTLFDESHLNPVEAMLVEWRESINEEIYERYLRHALRAIARQGNAIVVGRGANFILKCSECLNVRIVAPLELRIAMYIAGEGVSEQQAREWILQRDKIRAASIHRLFKHDIDDPLNYDLCINLAGLTAEMTAELIAKAAIMRKAEHLQPETKATLPKYIEILTRHRRPVRPGMV